MQHIINIELGRKKYSNYTRYFRDYTMYFGIMVYTLDFREHTLCYRDYYLYFRNTVAHVMTNIQALVQSQLNPNTWDNFAFSIKQTLLMESIRHSKQTVKKEVCRVFWCILYSHHGGHELALRIIL